MLLFTHPQQKKSSLYDRFAVEKLQNKRNLIGVTSLIESLQIIILELIIYLIFNVVLLCACYFYYIL